MDYKKVKLEELKHYHKLMPTSKTVLEYMDRIKSLGDGEAGVITLTAQDNIKSGAVKARLLRSAKLLGVNIVVRRYSNEVVFYRSEPEAKEAPKTKGKK